MTTRTQRWKDRRDQYRERGDSFHPSEYGVEPIPSDRTAKLFVEQHHYSGSYPAARCRVGLYRKRPGWFTSELVGVAVFSVPMQQASVPHYFPDLTPQEGIELGRFVLLDEVPFNAESWFLARAERVVRSELPGLRAILSYSDPLPRQDASGRIITPGHVGVIYQSRNAWYLGKGKPRQHYLSVDGRFVSQRGLSKIRHEEKGHEAATRALVALGAPVRHPGESPDAWVSRVLQSGCFQKVAHPGNHVYAWVFDREAMNAVAVQKYPKKNPGLATP